MLDLIPDIGFHHLGVDGVAMDRMMLVSIHSTHNEWSSVHSQQPIRNGHGSKTNSAGLSLSNNPIISISQAENNRVQMRNICRPLLGGIRPELPGEPRGHAI